MKAVVLREHGALDKLEYVTDFPDPQAIDGHVVIRVRATSFNYHDVFTVRGILVFEVLAGGGGLPLPADEVLEFLHFAIALSLFRA